MSKFKLGDWVVVKEGVWSKDERAMRTANKFHLIDGGKIIFIYQKTIYNYEASYEVEDSGGHGAFLESQLELKIR